MRACSTLQRAGALGLLVLWASAARAETLVSLTFDDSRASHREVREMLAEHGMKGTFYVITGKIGASTYLTLEDLKALAADGHEIGGHTVTHPALADLSLEEQRKEVCSSRDQLLAWGFQPTTFAYPYSSFTEETERIVEECGFAAARKTGGLSSCRSCPPAESVPPRDPFAIRATASVDKEHVLSDLQGWVTAAENAGGGWVTVVFHKQEDPCTGDVTCNSPQLLRDFLAWLAPRAALGTRVATVQEVLGLTPPPSDGGGDGATPPRSPSQACGGCGGMGATASLFLLGAGAVLLQRRRAR